jgi:PadR family transcriptional regulator PadR
MVLLAVLRAADEACGVAIARDIEQTTGRTVLLGAVYAALERLEKNGLAASTQAVLPRDGGRIARRQAHAESADRAVA